MSCNHLVAATKIQAFYSSVEGTLNVSAEVTFGPGNYGIEICRSLLDSPQTPKPAFLVSAPPPSSIQPQLVYTATVSESFALDKAPTTILVYSAGVDAPVRSEIPVGNAPSRALPAGTAAAAPAPVAALPIVAKEATGWSRTYEYHEALAAAVAQLHAAGGVGNRDVGLAATVVATGVHIGGFTANRGLYVTLRVG